MSDIPYSTRMLPCLLLGDGSLEARWRVIGTDPRNGLSFVGGCFYYKVTFKTIRTGQTLVF
jgi:hypothetical protein